MQGLKADWGTWNRRKGTCPCPWGSWCPNVCHRCKYCFILGCPVSCVLNVRDGEQCGGLCYFQAAAWRDSGPMRNKAKRAWHDMGVSAAPIWGVNDRCGTVRGRMPSKGRECSQRRSWMLQRMGFCTAVQVWAAAVGASTPADEC